MIIIGHPYIENKGRDVFLKSEITDDTQNKSFQLWYSVDQSYGSYFCDDRADAFLAIVLMAAMKSHQNIHVDAPVSSRLLYHINNTIQPIFKKLMPGSTCIQVLVPVMDCPELKGRGVGCGSSLGVDSLSALYRHMGDYVTDDYRVTHLALFNSGQLGYRNEVLNEYTFQKAIDGLTLFSKDVNLPIVAVNSNLNAFFGEYEFKTAKSRFVISTLSCPLALQKLFRKYIYASSTPIQNFRLSREDQSLAEAAYVPLLSTESMEIVLSDSAMTRVEKTDYIRRNPLTSKYLDVCWAVQLASSNNQDDRWMQGKTKKNCGWCDKCLRTLFTLELLGENLSKYDALFDLSQYYAHKGDYIKTVVFNRRSDHMCSEIYDLMRIKEFKIPCSVIISSKIHRLKLIAKKIIRLFRVR